MTRACALVALSFLVLIPSRVHAQKAAVQGPDLESGWLRLDTEGSGSYHGIDLRFPTAQLTPKYAKILPPPMDEGLGGRPSSEPQHKVGDPYVVYQPGVRAAGGGFGVGIDVNSAPFFLVQTKTEILITREGAGPGRHIFMDGRAHPDPSEYVLRAAGHSVGRYENGELIVDTTDFAPGMTGFGRGYHPLSLDVEHAYPITKHEGT